MAQRYLTKFLLFYALFRWCLNSNKIALFYIQQLDKLIFQLIEKFYFKKIKFLKQYSFL